MENLVPLASRLKPVVTKRAGLALALWGEAGIGKTFAAQTLLAAATCKSFSFHAALPLGDLVKALPHPSRLPLRTLRPLEGLERGEHVEASASADALAALLATLAPVVLHLEDLHEAAPERQELWGALAERVKRSRGAALLATSRMRPPEAFEAWRFEPLSEAGSASLLAVKVGTMLPQEANAWIYKRAQGNPLFTLEYLRYLSRQGYLWNDLRHWHWREPPTGFVPVTVEALIERTIEQASLSAASREALEAAAMLPLDAPLALWPALAGLSEDLLAAAEAELARCGFFKDGSFAHPLFREVTLYSLSPLRRCELSRRALAALKDDPLTAAGFVDDAGLQPEEVQALLKAAATQSLNIGDERQAGQLLGRALNYAQGPEQSELALVAAKLLRARDDQAALRLAKRAVEVGGADEAVYLLAELLASQHRLAEAETVLQKLSEAGRQNSNWPLRLARVYANAADFKKLLELVEAHPELPGADPLVGYTTSYAYLYTHKVHEAEHLARRMLATPLVDHERARFLGIFEAIALERGEYKAALRFSDERIALYRSSHQLHSLASALEKRAQLLETLDDYASQLSHLREALGLFAEVGASRRLAGTQADLGYALIQHGRYEEAEEILLQARELLSRLEVSDSHLLVEAFLTLLYYEWRPPHAAPLARRHARAVMQISGAWLWPIMMAGVYWTAAVVESWLGDPERSLALTASGIETAEALQHHNIHAANLYAQGLAQERLRRYADAKRSLEQAKALFRRAGFAERAERAALELDRLQGDLESARRRLLWFEERGLMNGINIAKRYFPELAQGEAVVPVAVESSAPRLELLGPMQVVHNGVSQSVRGQKRKELLACLLEAKIAGRAEVTQLGLLDSLYPGEPEDAAADSLKQLVFQLRKSLGVGTILRTTGGYALGNITSDAEDFLKTADTRLWRGVYREDAGEGEETVSSALYHALRMKTADLIDNNPGEAARLGRLLLQADPYDKESLRLTLKALQATGDHRTLTRLYQEGRIQLAEVGETLPVSWKGFLAQAAA